MPRHDRAHGVYQQPGRAGGSTSRRKTGAKKNTYSAKQSRVFVHPTAPAVDMPRQGGATPKPNTPRPQQPKPNPKAGKREFETATD